MASRPKQRPEALAQFAETARTDRKKDKPGLIADQATSPIPMDPEAKDEAATKVLQEGATGEDPDDEEVPNDDDGVQGPSGSEGEDLGDDETDDQGVDDVVGDDASDGDDDGGDGGGIEV